MEAGGPLYVYSLCLQCSRGKVSGILTRTPPIPALPALRGLSLIFVKKMSLNDPMLLSGSAPWTHSLEEKRKEGKTQNQIPIFRVLGHLSDLRSGQIAFQLLVVHHDV